ncbi:MAG TPA: type II secretion system F family protein [Mycobacteriales bacterium]|nr:type II secretion system F family protein [Mycobacteriales bacterium]
MSVITPASGSAGGPRMGRRWILAVATALAGWFGIGGVIGGLIGFGAAAGIILTAHVAAPSVTAAPDAVPVVVELLAGCLDAGLTMPDSLAAASVAGDPVIAQACLATAAALRRGAPADEAWSLWVTDPSLEPVARATRRTTQTGASVAEELRRVAARLRSRRQVRLQRRVQQASVWVVMPLGLFFLPAFVLVAVVPVVMGLFGSLR